MNVKTDTKERFTVIIVLDKDLPANMTGTLEALLVPYLAKQVPHLVLNLGAVEHITLPVAEKIASIQQQFYEKHCSFIVCEMQESVEKVFDDNNLLEFMNTTKTESEAWDILQMEEIERELLNDYDEGLNNKA